MPSRLVCVDSSQFNIGFDRHNIELKPPVNHYAVYFSKSYHKIDPAT